MLAALAGSSVEEGIGVEPHFTRDEAWLNLLKAIGGKGKLTILTGPSVVRLVGRDGYQSPN
jgi:hypothetical protein